MITPLFTLYFLPSLFLALLLGKVFATRTQDEYQIYSLPQYFPLIEKILLILMAITISQNQQIFLTSTFMLITIYAWQKA